jgi:hypothetical protein
MRQALAAFSVLCAQACALIFPSELLRAYEGDLQDSAVATVLLGDSVDPAKFNEIVVRRIDFAGIRLIPGTYTVSFAGGWSYKQPARIVDKVTFQAGKTYRLMAKQNLLATRSWAWIEDAEGNVVIGESPARPQEPDYTVSCVSGGERRWVARSKCDL